MSDEISKNEEEIEIELRPEKTDAIRERAFNFAVRIVKLCRYLEKHSDVSKSVIDQLLDAGTSIGANLEEAVAGQSRADFIHKNSISLKEARESNFWLRLILSTSEFEENVKKRNRRTERRIVNNRKNRRQNNRNC
jgi:four helix bundle protein